MLMWRIYIVKCWQFLNYKNLLSVKFRFKHWSKFHFKMKSTAFEMTSLGLMSFFLVLNAILICDVAADLNDESDVATPDENSTQNLNESQSNETAYQCIGPSKEAVKVYGILAWWMDGVVQVKLFHFLSVFVSLYLSFSLLFVFYQDPTSILSLSLFCSLFLSISLSFSPISLSLSLSSCQSVFFDQFSTSILSLSFSFSLYLLHSPSVFMCVCVCVCVCVFSTTFSFDEVVLLCFWILRYVNGFFLSKQIKATSKTLLRIKKF